MKYRIFINYRRNDTGKLLSKKVKEKIEAKGYTVFLDVDELHEGRFDRELLDNIEKCDYFVPLVTKDSFNGCENEKDWVRREIEHALKRGKKIVPILYEGGKFPDNLPDSIENVRNHNGVPLYEAYMDAGIKKFIEMITEVTPKSSINDDNDEFKDKFSDKKNAKLFLEEKPILLKDVYVEPQVVEYKDLSELFDKWLKESNSVDNDYTEFDTPVLLLCGKAGRKTSLVSELISNDVFAGKAHAIFLRKKVDYFDSSKPWTSVKKAFSEDINSPISNEEFKNKILILDGFDELCVLKSNFKGKEFLLNLSNELPKNVKVLITSREYKGYFEKVDNKNGTILVKNIKWTENEMEQWCINYLKQIKAKDKDKETTVQDWREHLMANYSTINSKIKEVLCTPIILYICCYGNIDVSNESTTICEIYDKAFKSIVSKEYDKFVEENGKKLKLESELSAENGAVIMWQLIKELAYQMYLNDRLDSGAGTDLIQKAKNRVKAIINDDSLTDDTLSKMLKKLPTVFHFATESTDGGYEFAHKTVVEYFTAVKIYEDYFAKYDKDYLSQYEENYFTKYDKDYLDETKLNDKEKEEIEEIKESVAELWQSFVEAFRYKELPDDILNYLCEMTEGKYSGKKDDITNSLDNVALKKTYGFGILLGYWSKYKIESPKSEYLGKTPNLSNQIIYIYRNLLLFSQLKDLNCDLRYADLRTADLRHADLRSADLRHADLSYADLRSTVLSSADLSYAKLIHAKFRSADLISVDLICADLTYADLRSVRMRSAKLIHAELNSANLCHADLIYADLSGADLFDANLTDADLRKAKYNAKTKFPNGFNPEKHGMILVD